MKEWWNAEVEIRINGGFPCIARAHIEPADTSVGIMAPYVEDFELLTMRGKPCTFLEVDDEEVAEAIEKAVAKLDKRH